MTFCVPSLRVPWDALSDQALLAQGDFEGRALACGLGGKSWPESGLREVNRLPLVPGVPGVGSLWAGPRDGWPSLVGSEVRMLLAFGYT